MEETLTFLPKRSPFKYAHFLVYSLPKDKKKSLSESDNYRAIGPSSLVLKLLDYIVIDEFKDVFETLDQEFAYKQNVSPTMCSFLVTETVQYYLETGSHVYAVSLDFSKAFDIVKYDFLFQFGCKCVMCTPSFVTQNTSMSSIMSTVVGDSRLPEILISILVIR